MIRSLLLVAILPLPIVGCGAVLSVSPEGETNVQTVLPNLPGIAGGGAADQCAALATQAADPSLTAAERQDASRSRAELGC